VKYPLGVLLSVLIACVLPAYAGGDKPAPTLTVTPSASDLKQSKAIDALCQAIDKASKKLPHRVYVDMADGMKTSGQWKIFKDMEAAKKACEDTEGCYDSCTLYSQDHHPVLAVFFFSSPSGDWSTSVNYYFRADGTVMKDQCEVRRFGAMDQSALEKGEDVQPFLVKVLRNLYYDPSGRMFYASPARFFNLDTGKEVPEPGYMDGQWPLFTKLSDLPFHSMIVDPK